MGDRFFVPQKAPAEHRLLHGLIDTLVLACMALGLLVLAAAGFSLPVGPGLYALVLLFCLLTAFLFQSRFCARFPLPVGFVLFLGYLLLLYLQQDRFLAGMRDAYGQLLLTLNNVYNGTLDAPTAMAAGGRSVSVFLAFVFAPLVLYLGFALLVQDHFLLAGILLFPLVTALVLCGAAGNTVGLFLLLFGVVLALAFAQPRRQKRMWGGKRTELRRQNALRFVSVQNKSVLLMLFASLVLSVPGFMLVRPMLSFSLKGAEATALEVQSGFLNRVLKLLPEISAGEWNLDLEAVGGGVLDGSLQSTEGYLLEDIEDLKLTLNRRPSETLFLKGFVGSSYQSGAWESSYGSTFDGAAMNWKTEGNPRLYIQNLPFLRLTYALLQRDNEDEAIASAMGGFGLEPGQLLVERINANDSYTYVPYGVYLNDYYEVQSGDGAIVGQKRQEDRYYFYFRSDLEEVLSVWNELEDTANVLDRVEESYHALCVNTCLSVEPFLSELQETVDAVKKENRWTAEKDTEEISAWIRAWLTENCSFEQIPPAAPEGEDPLEYFLFTSRKGNSVQFASAAVELFRMFGIPARYVVGYEAPAALFTAQSGGLFTATLQGDNSQAWAEIYVSGLGWLPKDMTPGVIGTFEEVGPGGERIEASVAEWDEEGIPMPEPTALPEEESEEEEIPFFRSMPERVTDRVNALLSANLTVEQVIRGIFFVLAALVLLGALIAGSVRFCRDYGYDPFHRTAPEQRLRNQFRAFYRRMIRLGLAPEADSQTEEFIRFSVAHLKAPRSVDQSLLLHLRAVLYASCFGSGSVKENDVLQLRALLRRVPLHKRINKKNK